MPEVTVRLILAGVTLDSGDVDRAEGIYRDSPASAARSAGLGAITMRRGDRDFARREWRLAITQGIDDPPLCYRYAEMGEQNGPGDAGIRAALGRAVALKPLSMTPVMLLYRAKRTPAVTSRRFCNCAMKTIAPVRAYDYWIALANSLNELGRREAGKSAAHSAAQALTTPAERAHAAELAYFAAGFCGPFHARRE